MRYVIVPAVAAALLASTSLAFATYPQHGTVESIDLQAMTLTLTNGKVFELPAGWNDPQVTPDDEVTVHYNIQGGKDLVTSVVIDENYEGGSDD